ncbi:hypothetical protein DID88_005731 [Monilinia fructigena]|uniref:Uncharacterized protein n=1 Tax=Monilinia fructigena TaxID=38457 RepID=A0A395J138_9HELO|nr:hypothetical protein DID88_005731 [Monilinia fructigena]
MDWFLLSDFWFLFINIYLSILSIYSIIGYKCGVCIRICFLMFNAMVYEPIPDFSTPRHASRWGKRKIKMSSPLPQKNENENLSFAWNPNAYEKCPNATNAAPDSAPRPPIIFISLASLHSS